MHDDFAGSEECVLVVAACTLARSCHPQLIDRIEMLSAPKAVGPTLQRKQSEEQGAVLALVVRDARTKVLRLRPHLADRIRPS